MMHPLHDEFKAIGLVVRMPGLEDNRAKLDEFMDRFRAEYKAKTLGLTQATNLISKIRHELKRADLQQLQQVYYGALQALSLNQIPLVFTPKKRNGVFVLTKEQFEAYQTHSENTDKAKQKEVAIVLSDLVEKTIWKSTWEEIRQARAEKASNIGGAPLDRHLLTTLRLELKEIGEALRSSTLQDSITLQLRQWHAAFISCLQSRVQAQEVLDRFILCLKEILKSPLQKSDGRQEPLDKEAFLGSDGWSYGKRGYTLFLAQSVEPYNRRSPLAPYNPKPFFVLPHDTARMMVCWLEEHRVNLSMEDTEKAYLALNSKPEIPLGRPHLGNKPICQIHAEQVKNDILKIKNQLQRCTLRDQLTQQIRAWHKEFAEFTTLENFQEALNTYIPRLQTLLQDAHWGISLDEEAFLGSDGYPYGKKSYSVYLSTVIDPYKTRSPMNMYDPEPFTLVPHTLARWLVNWLDTRNAYAPSEEIETLYNQLQPPPALPIYETPRRPRYTPAPSRPEQASPTAPVIDYSLIKELTVEELWEIRGQIDKWTQKDVLAGKIKAWHKDFTNFEGDEKKALNTFIPKLQDLLKDSLFGGTPLDEEALLGSDGFVYGKRSYSVQVSTVKEPLTFFPHALARFMVSWLGTRNARLPSDVIDNLFARLNPPPKLLIEDLPEVPKTEAPMDFDAIYRDISARLDTLEKKDKDTFESLSKEIQKLEKDVVELGKEIEDLKQEVKGTFGLISEEEKGRLQLRAAIAEMKLAAKRAERDAKKALFKAIVLSIVGAVATCATGGAATVAPFGISGIKVGTVVIF